MVRPARIGYLLDATGEDDVASWEGIYSHRECDSESLG
jgi:hypothetical protein